MGAAAEIIDFEREFRSMDLAWRALSEGGAADVEVWQRDLEKVAREEDDLRKRGLWTRGRADFFGVLGVHRDEVRHSRMIAWLLDPCARHGLGARVLDGVLRAAFGQDIPDAVLAELGAARTRCEVVRQAGRIDILVEAPGLALVVENKVDSPEGADQCDAYFRAFGADPGARFILLTPTGDPPVSASGDAAKAFRTLSYPALGAVLRKALDEVPKGGDGRHIAADYHHTLQKEFR